MLSVERFCIPCVEHSFHPLQPIAKIRSGKSKSLVMDFKRAQLWDRLKTIPGLKLFSTACACFLAGGLYKLHWQA